MIYKDKYKIGSCHLNGKLNDRKFKIINVFLSFTPFSTDLTTFVNLVQIS